jgi:hypothetical protein
MKTKNLMSKLGSATLAMAWIVALASVSHAQFMTVAPGGPSGYSAETVYAIGGPPPFTGPGALPVLFPPPPPNVPGPPGSYIIDAISSGGDAGHRYLYSVGMGAVGLPGTPVTFEFLVGTPPSQIFPGPPVGPLPPEPEGDIFRVIGPPFGVVGAALPLAFPDMTWDEFFLGFNVGDDLAGLMMRVPGGGIGTAFYSLGAGGLGPVPAYLPADVISPLLPLGVAWAPAPALSLDLFGPGTDDIDALLVQDLGIPGFFDPADFVAFSLTPVSATLAAPFGYSPGGGDLLVPDGPADPDPFPDIFIPAATFGLAPGDNLDAIDVAPGRPRPLFRFVGPLRERSRTITL